MEYKQFPDYEFSTTDMKTKEFDELTITYPSYLEILEYCEKLSFDSEGDFELEFYDEKTEEYSWVSLLTAEIDEEVRAADVTEIELKVMVSDFEDPVEFISLEHFLIDGYEAMFAGFDMADPFYDDFGTEYWMVGIYDYERSALFSINVQSDAGIYIDDCLAILSHIDFR